MKKIFLLLSVFTLIIFTSCGDDDGDSGGTTPGLTGSVTFDGQSYTIANGVFSLSESEGNAEGAFFLADGTLEVTSANQVSSSDSQIIISISATARDASVLANGDYATSTDIPDRFVDLAVTTAGGRSEAFTNGTVSITGSGNTYTIVFDAPFAGGVTLTGTVSGTYENP